MMSKLLQTLATLALTLGLATASHAATNDFIQCREFFPNSTLPVVPNAEELKPRALCFSAFAVLHSGKYKTPLYVVERLNREVLLNAQGVERTNNFYEEARLPRSERADLEDYKGSGYDRGHMAPAGDMATDDSMAQSFSLANMVPQDKTNNRKAWAKIESDTRKYIMHRAKGDVYVITGPVFEASHTTIGAGQVWVPTHIFKLVFDPSENKTWAHWIENTDEARAGKPISYEELVKRTGIKFLPGLK